MREIPTRYRSRRCTAADCGLRFPVTDGSPLGARCPICRAPTEWVDPAYTTHGVPPMAEPMTGPPRRRVAALLDNIRSLRNVGSMFRTADGAGLAHLYLGGVTPSPEHPKLVKTSLGAERSVSWSRHPDACMAAAELCAGGQRLWALEGGPRSRSIFDPAVIAAAAAQQASDPPLVLVLGHEVAGVDPRIVEQCEQVIHLPMHGRKDSLNVSVALGVAAYVLRFGLAPG
jgi:23S rRNA (guanosine2251-2'-O)-methyltransferase